MALSRKFLAGLGIEDDKISLIIEAHTESTDGLKAKVEEYKEKAEKYDSTSKELEKTRKELEGIKSAGGDWEKKYNKEHEDFEAYKAEQTAKETAAAKSKKYRDLLKDQKVSEAMLDDILGVTKLDEIEMDEKGELKDVDKLKEAIATKYKSFITKTETKGAKTPTPPGNAGGKLTKADIYKKDERGRFVMNTAERQAALAEISE